MAKASIKVGDKYITNEGCNIEVLEYVDCRRILIKFTDYPHCTRWVQSTSIQSGRIKCPYYPSVNGIGYIGEGEHKSTSDGYKLTPEAKLWYNMMNRCYSGRYECYDDVTVSEHWHNYQNFCNDLPELIGYDAWERGEDFQLDKDILSSGGNKQYGRWTCAFVPKYINLSYKGWEGRLSSKSYL